MPQQGLGARDKCTVRAGPFAKDPVRDRAPASSIKRWFDGATRVPPPCNPYAHIVLFSDAS